MAREHDVIVIGLGVGGEEVGGTLGEAGLDVLGVEKKLVGGECPYWGCIPSKVMVRAGNSLAEAARATGLAGDLSISPRWAPVAARVRDVTANWNDDKSVDRFEGKGGTFLRGEARIVDDRTIEVDGERHTARRGLVISTGGAPAAPPIEGLDEIDYWTNREAIEATELPGSLVVLGAGPIGLELAQTFYRFGTKTTVVELADHALPLEEPENGDAVAAALSEEGMKLLTGTSAESVKQTDGDVVVTLSDGTTLEAERLLVATGRRLRLDALGTDAVGIDPKARAIDTDERMRAGDGLWAVGDVTGKGAFTHMAVYQGRIAAADILGREHTPADYTAVPRVTFTDPEVASVGLTEAQARDEGIDVSIGVAETASSTRGWIHGPGAEHGVAKLIADGDRGVLVGGSVMGPAAGEILGLIALAVRQKVPVAALRDLIYPYPTFVRGLEDALRQLD